jgi:hypothetical protein
VSQDTLRPGPMHTDRNIARERLARRALIEAPITRGILATITYAGRTSAGSGSTDGPLLPCGNGKRRGPMGRS